ncbi:hypothetical protein X798_03668 [Onchocerca flexuosa]|uniref:Uncharacterized protein n=1 Tax=Onchocerca flexuosa TaxID=387005 RepID=A0A238BVG1_9BILA|nr:hypothetical protein X798_03668 [Onchocerca flexuosa]
MELKNEHFESPEETSKNSKSCFSCPDQAAEIFKTSCHEKLFGTKKSALFDLARKARFFGEINLLVLLNYH